VTPSAGLEWTGLALGVALVGGTSAFGRRGGVFGTILAAVLATLFLRYEEEMNWDISEFAIAGGALAAGLVVTRLVESYGRPRFADAGDEPDDDNWSPEPDPTITSNWSSTRRDRQDSWVTPLPAQPAGGRSDPWDDDRWGTTGR
jgi:hypothetical protein